MAIANITNNILSDSGVATSSLLTTASAASTYLPLAGGTLTGALNGTSATFNGNINIDVAQPRIFIRKTSNTQESDIIFYENTNAHWALYDAPTTNDFGIYNYGIGLDNLKFSYSTGAATFSSSVGIGVSPTAGKLHILAPSSVSYAPVIAIRDEGNPTFGFSFKLDTAVNGDLRLDAVNNSVDTPLMTFKRVTGNVGIGTVSPNIYNLTNTRNLTLVNDAGYGVIASVGSSGNGGEIDFGTSSIRHAAIASLDGSNLGFYTNGSNSGTGVTEKMRITSGGFLKVSNTGSYVNVTAPYHEFLSNQVGANSVIFTHTHSSDTYGPYVYFQNAAPNNSTNYFLYCGDNVSGKFIARSNGGLANFQANDVNLSDERTKKDIEPLESYWDKFKAIEIVKFKYKDQTHDDFNIGVIAQQVEAVAPEFVDVDGWDTKFELDEEGNEIVSEEEPLKSIYTADLHHATIKVLQEAMAKIEKLETEIDSLKNQMQ